MIGLRHAWPKWIIASALICSAAISSTQQLQQKENVHKSNIFKVEYIILTNRSINYLPYEVSPNINTLYAIWFSNHRATATESTSKESGNWRHIWNKIKTWSDEDTVVLILRYQTNFYLNTYKNSEK